MQDMSDLLLPIKPLRIRFESGKIFGEKYDALCDLPGDAPCDRTVNAPMESSMRECPVCHLHFPDSANFCPMDRSKLVPLAVPEKGEADLTKSRKKFSETQWFLEAEKTDALQDIPKEKTREEDVTEKYRVEDKLTEDVRKKYSLSQDIPRERPTLTFFKKFYEDQQEKPRRWPIVLAILLGIIAGAAISASLVIYFLK